MGKSQKIKDSCLVEQYCSGNKNAMALLVKRWHGIFCKQAYLYAKDYDIAKDIAQDTWIAILKNIETIENVEKFGSWGLSIVTRKSLDWYRKNKRITEKQMTLYKENRSVPEEVNQVEEQSTKQKLKTAIALLTREQQVVLQLFYIESYGIVEISKILELSKGTVKSRLFYAREKLKQTLKN